MLKQVIILRKDLNLRKGKMIAQGAHASRGACKGANPDLVYDWELSGQTKIVLGVDSGAGLIDLYNEIAESEISCYLVRDRGNIEVPPNTVTALGVGPDKAEKIDKFTGMLNLL